MFSMNCRHHQAATFFARLSLIHELDNQYIKIVKLVNPIMHVEGIRKWKKLY